MTPNERIRDDHPYGPLFRAWERLRDAEKRKDTRSIHLARKQIGQVRHDLMRGVV